MQKREFLKSGLAALGGLGWMATGAFAKEIPESKDIQWDETWDVIIVGTGIAGTCAGMKPWIRGAKKSSCSTKCRFSVVTLPLRVSGSMYRARKSS